jgi:hypothetical protein
LKAGGLICKAMGRELQKGRIFPRCMGKSAETIDCKEVATAPLPMKSAQILGKKTLGELTLHERFWEVAQRNTVADL